jgi:hypothetical protein
VSVDEIKSIFHDQKEVFDKIEKFAAKKRLE